MKYAIVTLILLTIAGIANAQPLPPIPGELPPILARAVTAHHFDPCELLGSDARSEILPEFREREQGGGWRMTGGSCAKPRAS